MSRFERWVASWWFGEAFVLVLCVGVLVVAWLMAPTEGMLSLFGVEVPVLCTIRRSFGVDCPGCGLTRSFVYLAHGDAAGGLRMNWLGPPLFFYTAAQIPYRALRLWRIRPKHAEQEPE